MDVIVRILVGAFTGWLTGKAAGVEGYERAARGGHVIVLDMVYGTIGAMVGEYLFFWIVIGKGSTFSDYATVVLGAIAVVGAARLLAARLRRLRSYKRNTSPRSFGVEGVSPDRIDQSNPRPRNNVFQTVQ